MNYHNNHGMSYIEVLVSAVILSVIILPLVAGFRQASVNYLRSQDIYLAGTNCSNLLLSAERALENGFPDSTETIKEFLNDEDFFDSYDLDKFDYVIRINEVNSDGQILSGISLSTGPESSEAIDTEIDGVNFIMTENPSLENLIEYDAGFFTSGCPYAEFSGDTCTISVNQPDVSINFDARMLDSPVTFELYNNSPGILTLTIFSGVDSENIQDLIKIVSPGNGGSSAVCFRTLKSGKESGKNYLLTAEVYDKNERLLNRLAKLI